MVPEPELAGLTADNRLLEPDFAVLPAEIGRPAPLPRSRARGRIVAAGATMTGITLVGGTVLVVAGLIALMASGASAFALVLLGLGIVLVATHWGWVHVAELTANSVERRGQLDAVARRQDWLAGIAPYTRQEVVTEVEDDGSLAILTVAYQPVASSPGRFLFSREVVAREVHGAEEPAATVAERAERLRRAAAEATDAERERFQAIAGAREMERLRSADERELRELRQAASRALSEQINARLRDPPVD